MESGTGHRSVKDIGNRRPYISGAPDKFSLIIGIMNLEPAVQVLELERHDIRIQVMQMVVMKTELANKKALPLGSIHIEKAFMLCWARGDFSRQDMLGKSADGLEKTRQRHDRQ